MGQVGALLRPPGSSSQGAPRHRLSSVPSPVSTPLGLHGHQPLLCDHAPASAFPGVLAGGMSGAFLSPRALDACGLVLGPGRGCAGADTPHVSSESRGLSFRCPRCHSGRDGCRRVVGDLGKVPAGALALLPVGEDRQRLVPAWAAMSPPRLRGAFSPGQPLWGPSPAPSSAVGALLLPDSDPFPALCGWS